MDFIALKKIRKKLKILCLCLLFMIGCFSQQTSVAAVTGSRTQTTIETCKNAEKVLLRYYYTNTFENGTKAPSYGDGMEYIIFSMARSNYPVKNGFYSQYYQNLRRDLSKVKTQLEPLECAKIVMALSAMGRDASKFKEYPLIATMCKKKNLDQSKMMLKWPTVLLALDCRNYKVPTGSAFYTRKQLVKKVVNYCKNYQGGTYCDQLFMYGQALMPYAKSNKAARTQKQHVYQYLKSHMSAAGYIGNSNNVWTNTQALIFLGEGGYTSYVEKLVSSQMKYIHISTGKIDFTFDRAQVARGLNSARRMLENRSGLFDCNDVRKVKK
ncbi:MAG: hypothetical protein ACI4CT_02700 [Lachnospiraceae bacterium]